jgi:hypothetical protein
VHPLTVPLFEGRIPYKYYTRLIKLASDKQRQNKLILEAPAHSASKEVTKKKMCNINARIKWSPDSKALIIHCATSNQLQVQKVGNIFLGLIYGFREVSSSSRHISAGKSNK